MQTKMKIECTKTGCVRMVFSDTPEGENTTISRHWDLGVVDALQVASQLINSATMLLQLVAAKNAQKQEPKEESPAGDGTNGASS